MILHFNNNGVLVRAEGTLSEANRKLLIKLLTEDGAKPQQAPEPSLEYVRTVLYNEVQNYYEETDEWPLVAPILSTVRTLTGCNALSALQSLQYLVDRNKLTIQKDRVELNY